MRRFLGAVLVGVGALLIVAAVGLPLYVAPAVTKLPYDMRPCKAGETSASCLKPSVVEAKGAQYLSLSGGVQVKTGDLRTTVEVIPQAKVTADEQTAGRLDDNAVVWDVYTTVQEVDGGTVISKSSTEMAMDRVTGEAVNWSGQWIEESGGKDTSIKYSGQVYKFPFGTEKKDYPYYDTDTRSATAAKFQNVETIEGVEVYHFVQQIPDTQVSVAPDSLAVLVNVFAPGATSGKVLYRNTRDVWVDPVTGAFLKVRERPHQEFQADNGVSKTLLDADFTYTDTTIKNTVDSASSNGTLLKTVNLYAPVGLGLLGLIALIGGFLLARRRPSEGGEGSGWDDSLPEPRHQLKGEEVAAT